MRNVCMCVKSRAYFDFYYFMIFFCLHSCSSSMILSSSWPRHKYSNDSENIVHLNFLVCAFSTLYHLFPQNNRDTRHSKRNDENKLTYIKVGFDISLYIARFIDSFFLLPEQHKLRQLQYI